jgi:hypothetical protein
MGSFRHKKGLLAITSTKVENQNKEARNAGLITGKIVRKIKKNRTVELFDGDRHRLISRWLRHLFRFSSNKIVSRVGMDPAFTSV